MKIICNCGARVTKRVNRNGVVLCPRCKAAFTPEQFSAPERTRCSDGVVRTNATETIYRF
jgi:hypothetical protein